MAKLILSSSDISVVDWTITGKEDLFFEYTIGSKRQKASFPINDLNREKIVEIVTKGRDIRSILRPEAKKNYNVVPLTIESHKLQPKSITFSTSWLSHKPEISYGLSDYSYLSNFMPRWSTAYKFPWSTHSKLVEPYFSNIMYMKKALKERLRGDVSSDNSREFLKTKSFSTGVPNTHISLSREEDSKLLVVTYLNDSELTVDFGYTFNKLYLQSPTHTYDFDVLIEGEYNSQFFIERKRITDDSLILLDNPYHKVHNITIIPTSEFDPSYFPLVISNYLPLSSGFKYKHRGDTTLTLQSNSIVLNKNNKEHRTFQLPLSNAEGHFVTEDDHIISLFEGKIYSGKLDLKMNLPIPRDVSYNNSRFIEETKLSVKEYELELFLNDYLSYSAQDMVAVRVEDSEGIVLYLNEDLELVPSSKPIYLPSTVTKQSKSLTLSLELVNEYTIIKLEDYEHRYTVSHLICHPIIEQIPSMDLPNIELEHYNFEFDRKPTIEEIEPIIVDDRLWLRVVCNTSLYHSKLIPIEYVDSRYTYRDRYNTDGDE